MTYTKTKMKRKRKLSLAIPALLLLTCPVSAQNMAHWANIRDEGYNIIGQVQAGEDVTVGSVDSSDPSRTWITTADGIRGTVSTVYIYGGTDDEYDDPWSYSPDADGWDEITLDDPRTAELITVGIMAEEAMSDETSYTGYGTFSIEITDGVLRVYHDGQLVMAVEVVE